MTRKSWITARDCEKFKEALRREEDCYFVNIGGRWRLLSQKEAEQIDNITPLARYFDSCIVKRDFYELCQKTPDVRRFLTKSLAESERAHKAMLERLAELESEEITAKSC